MILFASVLFRIGRVRNLGAFKGFGWNPILSALGLLVFFTSSTLNAQINYYNLPGYEIPKYGWTNNLGVVGGYQQYDAKYTNTINVLSKIPGTNIVAYGDGIHDDTIAIQTAINLAPNGSVVYLPKPPAYYLNTNSWHITGNKHIIMRGDYNQSWIYRQIPLQVPLILVDQGSIFSTYGATTKFTNGSESVNVSGASSSMIKNYYIIASTVAPPDVISNGCSDNGDYNFNYVTSTTFPSGSIPMEVVQVTNVVGNTVYFTPPCRWDLTNGGTQGLIEVSDYNNSANRCGIENLNLTITTNLQLAGGSSGWATIQFGAVQDCWITGCILATNAPEAIQWDYCSHYTAESNILDHSYDYVGSWGYGYYGSLCDNDGLIENCIAYNLRHAYVTQGYQTCIVYGYDYETNECFRSSSGTPVRAVSGSYLTHGQGIKYGLTEGCVGDFYSYDNVHANSSHCTMLRDASFPITHNDDWPAGLTNVNGTICVNVAMNNNWVAVVGCVLGMPSYTKYYQSDPTNTVYTGYSQVVYAIGYSCGNSDAPDTSMVTNLFRDHNYDVVTGQVLSDPGATANTVAPSYYLLSKPGWWGNGAWPPIGADLSPIISVLPAESRFSGTWTNSPVTNSPPVTNSVPLIAPTNRQIAWNPGVAGGVPTNYTLFCNVLTGIPGTNLVAHGDGLDDDTLALQTAVNLATNQSVIYIPTGTYIVSNGLSIMGNKHLVLRGDYGQTWLNYTSAAPGNVITINQWTIGASNTITSGVTNGSFSAGVSSTSGMLSNYWAISSTALPPDCIPQGCDGDGSYLHNWRQIVQITNVVGSTVYFTPPCRWDLTNAGTVYFWEVSDYNNSPNRCGIENINMSFVNSNTAPLSDLVYISGAQNCWVKGCELKKTVNNAIELTETSFDTIESNVMHHAWDYVDGWGCGVWEFDVASDNLIQNNVFYNLCHAYLSEGFVTGTVIGYNYETNECFRDIPGAPAPAVGASFLTHAIGAKYLLFEGNMGDFLQFDNLNGNSSLCTVFRNRLIPVTFNDDWPSGLTNVAGTICIANSMNNNFESVIGNVLGMAGASAYYESNPTNNVGYAQLIYANGFSCNDTSGSAVVNSCITNILRVQNYDTVTGTIRTDAGVIITNLPTSYYLTAKPAWWGSGAWPAIGADLTPMVNVLPAATRYSLLGTVVIPPPQNFYASPGAG